MKFKDKYLAFRSSVVVQHMAVMFLTSFGGMAVYILTPEVDPLKPVETAARLMADFSTYKFNYMFWDNTFGAALVGSVVPHLKLFINKYLNYTVPPQETQEKI